MKLLNRVLNLLFPPKCPFCGTIRNEPGICEACRAALHWTEEPERKIPGGARCASPLWYEDRARDAMLRFKFQGAVSCAEPFGALLAQCAAERFSGEFDVVTWVPVSRRRLHRRGYDQAKLLAEAACTHWNTKPEPLLRKQQDNPAQSGLEDPAQRRANVLGIYSADARRICGRRILLVDDIVTTGSTLGEAVRTLRSAGAADVVCVTLCRTPKRPIRPCADKNDESGKNVLAK